MRRRTRIAGLLGACSLIFAVLAAGCVDVVAPRETSPSPTCTPYCAGETSPSWSPDGGRLALASDHDGDSDIYVVNLRTARVRQLTNNEADDLSPSWSPDGRLIAFVSDRDGRGPELYLMNADGSNQTRLTRTNRGDVDDSRPAWSPDARWLAFAVSKCDIEPTDADYSWFSRVPQCTDHVSVLGVDRSRQHRLGAQGDTYPAWSRAGVLMFLTGDGLVVQSSGRRRSIPRTYYADVDPSWSPDGHRIAYSRDGQIQIIRPDGTGWRVPFPEYFSDPIREDYGPVWSPDGQTIAFSRTIPRTKPILESRPASIFFVHPDGTGVRKLKPRWPS